MSNATQPDTGKYITSLRARHERAETKLDQALDALQGGYTYTALIRVLAWEETLREARERLADIGEGPYLEIADVDLEDWIDRGLETHLPEE